MKFLVIDDEPLVRRSLARALRARGHDCVEASDGDEGLRLWRDEKPEAVFVDVLMPGLSGPDVVRRALVESPLPSMRPSIALISAFSGEDSERLAEDCGADCFISKPFENIFAVVDRLASLVNAKRHVGGN